MSGDTTPIPVPGSAGVRARPFVRCQVHGQINPCGVLDLEQIAAASAAGVCCRVWLARTRPVSEAVPADGWPPFTPTDDDVPGGDW